MLSPNTHEDLVKVLATLKVDDPESGLVVTLTSSLAQSILDANPFNRKLDLAKVDQYARIMTDDCWRPARSAPIMFLPDFRAADGQHRCHAVIKTGKSIATRVILVADTYGVDEAKPRTFADYLRLHQKVHDEDVARLVPAITSAICTIPKPTDRELMQTLEENETFVLECASKPLDWLRPHVSTIAKIARPQLLAVVRAIAIRHEGIAAETTDEFLFEVVNDGTGDKRCSKHAKQVMAWLRNQYENRERGGGSPAKKLLATLKLASSPDAVRIGNIITAVGRRKKRTPKVAVAA